MQRAFHLVLAAALTAAAIAANAAQGTTAPAEPQKPAVKHAGSKKTAKSPNAKAMSHEPGNMSASGHSAPAK